jgi:hypothetical protein
MPLIRSVILTSLFAMLSATSYAVETVRFNRQNQPQTVAGRLILKAGDGGLLIQANDGRIWTLQPEEIVSHTTDAKPFVPLKAAEIARQVQRELGPGFSVHTTVNYVLVYNTTKTYAQWVGGLLERLQDGFDSYWTKLGFKTAKPEFPLVVLVFDGVDSYGSYTKQDLQGDPRTVVAYYNQASNRVSLYDLTGVEALRGPGNQRGSTAQINTMLSQPEAQLMVATIIHEATHQLAYNSGLQQRFADVPIWFSEGMAVYFETPDLTTVKGWRTIGEINRLRLTKYREHLPQKPRDSLSTLAMNNERFLRPRDSLDAYAEAWALTHYLLKAKPQAYVAYLQKLSAKPPFVWDEPEERLKEFREAFGDPKELDAELGKYIGQLK